MAETAGIRLGLATVPVGADLCDSVAQRVLEGARVHPLGASEALLLLPNNRGIKAMTEAFVRLAAPGLLLPRMVAIGDLALDEKLGSLLDPLDVRTAAAKPILPAQRTMLLGRLVKQHRRAAGLPVSAAEAIRLARELAAMIDELEIEGRDERELEDDPASEGVMAGHWQRAYRQLLAILPDYRRALRAQGMAGPAERRNMLLDALRNRFQANPPTCPVIAVGITTSARAIADLLGAVARLPQGLVVLPGLDIDMPDADWDALGSAEEGDDGHSPQETHPQYHLKRLIERMHVRRDEFSEMGKASADSAAIKDIFCLAEATEKWREQQSKKALRHVTVLHAADSAEEARAISIAARELLEQSGKRVALITPDRELALRVSAQLKRWNIEVDDSAGTRLAQTPSGTLLLALAKALADRFTPVSLLALLKHPLVKQGEERLEWLDRVRELDLILRGPAKGVGLAAISRRIAEAYAKSDEDKARNARVATWWDGVLAELLPVEQRSNHDFASVMNMLAEIAGKLSLGAVWKGTAGRQLAECWEDYLACDLSPIDDAEQSAIPAILSELFASIVVRPPYGGHPRVAIYGLLEARLQQADFLICGGLNEGSWPQLPQPDPWLSPIVRRRLALATLDRNIGLSAHDLAIALGADRVLLTRAERDRGGPTVASRFLLRIEAYLGDTLKHDKRLLGLARRIDASPDFDPAKPPIIRPSAEQRLVDLSITDFDRLKADPFAFYANKILSLRALDPVDAPPGHAWRGSAIHEILELWAKADGRDPEKLLDRAKALLSDEALHPILRALWQPRISAALRWVAEEAIAQRDNDGRDIIDTEKRGSFELAGVTISGRADRIDRLADGGLAIVDYKKGTPPSNAQVTAGFALQLGLLGMMADADGFKDIKGQAERFEYWSLGKPPRGNGFGYIQNPVSGKNGAPATADEFMAAAERSAADAITKWITGSAAFTAKLHPKYATYADYDQLMRLQGWDGRQDAREGADA